MERHRDHLRSARHAPRILIVAATQEDRAMTSCHPTASGLSRRRLLVLGAAGALVGLAPPRAAAGLKLDVTQGNVQPIPIAPPDFSGIATQAPALGRSVSQIIASNLQRSGLFLPIDQAA